MLGLVLVVHITERGWKGPGTLAWEKMTCDEERRVYVWRRSTQGRSHETKPDIHGMPKTQLLPVYTRMEGNQSK